ncbi:N-6 DNA methylase [Nonomuraea sp. SBT364]|uniref:N-6 DNA methylase n=1 Tax=Nonomuraea sp. SBT364 TaxID=1580530 RepID=UPI00066A3112|nr:N-6 DNA methylase [Nonomuraea sp. SBT364]
MDRDVQVTAADIARLGDVGRAAVSNWRRRHEDFPQPVGGTATSPTFSLSEIKDWLRAHTEARPLPRREWFWQELRAGVPEEELPALIADLGSFLLRARGGGARPEGEVQRGVAELAAEHGPEETFHFLYERYAESQRASLTPKPVADLMAALLPGAPRRVLDPACGWGMLLRAVRERSGGQLLGQDLSEATARLTAISLAFDSGDADIRAGDALRADAFPGAAVDAVVCNPPFNDRNWGYEELTADARWEYGLPPRTEPELAWVQHALAHLVPGGFAVLLMPPAAAGRRSGRRIRAQLLRRGALRAVIALPVGSVPNMSVGLTLWVLRRPGETPPPGHVLMVDTSAGPDDFAGAALAAWERFRRGESDGQGEGEGGDEPGVSRAVPVIDLLNDEVDLLPGRYLPATPTGLSPERIVRSRDRLHETLADTLALLPGIELAPAGRDRPLVPVAELERRNLLTVHQQAPVRPGETSGVPGDASVLTAEDVVRHRPATGRAASLRKEIRTRPGDVVVPQVVRKPMATVVSDGGDVIGTQLHLLRPDPERLDPHFLAGFLTAQGNLRHYASMSSTHRVDVRRAEIPLLPIEEQRAYGRAFRHLQTLTESLRQLAEHGADLVQDTLDGLTGGLVLLSADDPAWRESE